MERNVRAGRALTPTVEARKVGLVKGCMYAKYVFPLSPHCYPPDCISFLLCQKHTPLMLTQAVERHTQKEACKNQAKIYKAPYFSDVPELWQP